MLAHWFDPMIAHGSKEMINPVGTPKLKPKDSRLSSSAPIDRTWVYWGLAFNWTVKNLARRWRQICSGEPSIGPMPPVVWARMIL